MSLRITSPLVAGTIASVGLLVLAGCGSGSSDAAGDDQIASLGTVAAASDASGEASQDSLSADEAAFEFSQCLRDQGLDVADIGVDATGTSICVRRSTTSIRATAMSATAMDACQDILGDVGFGGAGRGPDFDDTALQDAFLEFSDCVRDQGFEDVADLSFQAPGGGGPGAGGPGTEDGAIPPSGPPPGEGERPADFGDRNALLAEGLGLDPEDPAVIAALDECSPIIDNAFGDFGPGAAPTAGEG